MPKNWLSVYFPPSNVDRHRSTYFHGSFPRPQSGRRQTTPMKTHPHCQFFPLFIGFWLNRRMPVQPNFFGIFSLRIDSVRAYTSCGFPDNTAGVIRLYSALVFLHSLSERSLSCHLKFFNLHSQSISGEGGSKW